MKVLLKRWSNTFVSGIVMRKMKGNRERQPCHAAFVECLIGSAEEDCKLYNKVTKPTPWRSGTMLFCEPEEDAADGVVGESGKRMYRLSTSCYCQKYLHFCIRWTWRCVANEREHHSTFFIPKSTTGERPIALLPTLLRWWEWLGRCAKVVGGAESAGSESLLVIEACLI